MHRVLPCARCLPCRAVNFLLASTFAAIGCVWVCVEATLAGIRYAQMQLMWKSRVKTCTLRLQSDTDAICTVTMCCQHNIQTATTHETKTLTFRTFAAFSLRENKCVCGSVQTSVTSFVLFRLFDNRIGRSLWFWIQMCTSAMPQTQRDCICACIYLVCRCGELPIN